MEPIPYPCLINILGHIKDCWNYDYPTGKTLENAFYEGLKPFYPNSKKLGSPSTIVDSGKDNDGFDIKGNKVLGHIIKETRRSNHEHNIFVTQNIPNFGKIKVRIPHSIVTQVRRPKVDLKKFTGNSKKILDEQVADYREFAEKSTLRERYENLFSIVLLYGIDKEKGIKSVFLTVEKFGIPEIERYDIGYKEDKETPCSYRALNVSGDVVFMLSSFNKGSSNLYKRFPTTSGILMSWPIEEKHSKIHTEEELLATCAIQKI